MTAQQWIQSLLLKRQITVDSTSNLANKVKKVKRSKSYTGIPKNITGVPGFDPPLTIDISPLKILFAVGKITTPRVRNLIDLSSTWAFIRYLWAFDPTILRNLVLSRYSRGLDKHQKAVLSDDMGLAFSDILIRRYFNGIWPQPVDIALQNQNPRGIQLLYKTSPDYIYKIRTGGYVVVECKGTSSGIPNSIKQLGRGSEQVSSVIIGKTTPLCLIIGTCMNYNETIINLIDPPAEGDFRDNTFFYDGNTDQFDQRIQNLNAANLLRYSGLDELSNEFFNRSEVLSDVNRLNRSFPIVTRNNVLQGESFTGIISPDYYLEEGLRARIFKGISNHILDGVQNDVDEGLIRINNYQERLNSFDIPRENREDHDIQFESNNSVNIISDDGMIMSIEIEEV